MSIKGYVYSSFEAVSRDFAAVAPPNIQGWDWHVNLDGFPFEKNVSSFPTVFMSVMASGVETSSIGQLQTDNWEYAQAVASGFNTGFGVDNQSYLSSVTKVVSPTDAALFLSILGGDVLINSGTYLICQLLTVAPERYSALTKALPQLTKDKITAAALQANLPIS